MKKKILVIGASTKPERYSYLAMHKLVNHGYEVVAIGLKQGIVAGITIDTELFPYENIHTVTLYVNAQAQKEYYDYIISLNPKRVIFNPGTENPEFYLLLEKHLIFYEVACTLVLLSTNQF
ncbi:MAG: CoA-binding protein [Flavobacteriales bacterium]|nr:CoA-binding protein [Flavobacteriales bacterium]PIV94396.1 MAG: CoA-binding protein [Flavobacteriaceae bacterium CG17_big_fil_post_rev_8_21_14_2_50_33_15]PJB20104.1 MAG: CoA-binding protein [Flavobacteriaceae bacterium CG_4_9_14_3_um_filter_33_16]NCP58722.1 CoA-binding protein [Flavobacteriales bacterium]NCP90999.1 CoA-binding protein [Flavobacteriales bacterium]